jgi:hypothetical protein
MTQQAMRLACAYAVLVCTAGGQDRLADPIDLELLMEYLPPGVRCVRQVVL